MRNSNILVVVAALPIVALSSGAMGQDKATAREVVAKIREAARTLSRTHDLAPFNRKQGPWVWSRNGVVIVTTVVEFIPHHSQHYVGRIASHGPRRNSRCS